MNSYLCMIKPVGFVLCSFTSSEWFTIVVPPQNPSAGDTTWKTVYNTYIHAPAKISHSSKQPRTRQSVSISIQQQAASSLEPGSINQHTYTHFGAVQH